MLRFLIIYKNIIGMNLILDYVNAIRSMQYARHDIKIYMALDHKRRDLNDKILKKCNIDRNDEGFSFQLASLVEGMIY